MRRWRWSSRGVDSSCLTFDGRPFETDGERVAQFRLRGPRWLRIEALLYIMRATGPGAFVRLQACLWLEPRRLWRFPYRDPTIHLTLTIWRET